MDSEIKDILRPILGSDVDQEIIEYILRIKQEDDLDEFLSNIIDPENSEHAKVAHELKSLLIGKDSRDPHSRRESDKSNLFDSSIKSNNKKNKKSNITRNNQGGDLKTSKELEFSSKKNFESNIHGIPNVSNEKQENDAQSSSKGKKASYVSFDTFRNTPGLKKGRHPCNCEARKHALVNNCQKCGRIVCEQEGSGPCFFCDNMVGTKEEMEILSSNSKESSKLYNKLVDQKKSKEWKKAIEMRNKLLSRDQMGDVKNRIYDDQGDYFDTSSAWLSSEERERLKKAQELRHGPPKSRTQMKVALDLASRVVREEQDEFAKNKDKLMNSVNKLLDATEKRFPKNLFEGEKEEFFAELTKAIENNSGPTKILLEHNKDVPKVPMFKRSVNPEFLEHVDRGLCLSMHQPWASLLVAGIKVHEGRTWKTDHRGRLWIHAGSKEPEDEEILACEEMYRNLYNDPTLQFPKKYPTSCLLGCVFVEDCLPQKEYRKKYPDGESNSPYILICSNPVILPIFIPMSGQHKIFALDKEMHRRAKEAIMAATWI